MRWLIAVVFASTACGRLAFDELAVVTTDAAGDGPANACTTIAFDQLPPDMVILGNGTVEVSNGQVKFGIPGPKGIDSYLELVTATSFIGRSISLQVPSPSLTPMASTAFGWHEQTGERIGVHMEMDGFNLKLNQYNPTADQYDEFVSLAYDAVEFAWWQLREDQGNIVAEVSRDGVVWNPFGVVAGRDVSSMKWDIGIGAYVADVPPSESTADNAVTCIP